MNPSMQAANPYVLLAISIFVSSMISTIIAGFLAYLAFRIQFERFRAMDAEREKHWNKWREDTSKDVEALKFERNNASRLEQCERFIQELRDFKHEIVEPYIREVGKLRDRIDRMGKTP